MFHGNQKYENRGLKYRAKTEGKKDSKEGKHVESRADIKKQSRADRKQRHIHPQLWMCGTILGQEKGKFEISIFMV